MAEAKADRPHTLGVGILIVKCFYFTQVFLFCFRFFLFSSRRLCYVCNAKGISQHILFCVNLTNETFIGHNNTCHITYIVNYNMVTILVGTITKQ